MLQIFDQVEPWPTKVNFVDSNNVGVGYDMRSSCCEIFGWFISESPDQIIRGNEDEIDPQLVDYVFDPEFFEDRWQKGDFTRKELTDTNIAIFRLISDIKPPLYLYIYNSHNGYYSHGFTANVGGVVPIKGTL